MTRQKETLKVSFTFFHQRELLSQCKSEFLPSLSGIPDFECYYFSELVSKMLSKTTKEIEIAKTKSATTPSSEKKSIKNLKANAAASPSIGTDKNKLLSSIKKSAEARYRMVQTKRDTNDLISDEAHDKNMEQSNNIDKELKSLYQLYDLELEESESNSNNRKQRYLFIVIESILEKNVIFILL